MRRFWFLGTVGIIGGTILYIYSASLHKAEADPLDAALLQTPLPAAIQRELASHDHDTPPLSPAQRQDLFAERFTERFRDHEPKMAIRARFETINRVRNRIKLMCPARLEPWNMDRVALSAWRESRDCLGECYDVDLYETFIGAAPRKIGELRTIRDGKSMAEIHYLPRPELETIKAPQVVSPSRLAPFHRGAARIASPTKLSGFAGQIQ